MTGHLQRAEQSVGSWVEGRRTESSFGTANRAGGGGALGVVALTILSYKLECRSAQDVNTFNKAMSEGHRAESHVLTAGCQDNGEVS